MTLLDTLTVNHEQEKSLVGRNERQQLGRIFRKSHCVDLVDFVDSFFGFGLLTKLYDVKLLEELFTF